MLKSKISVSIESSSDIEKIKSCWHQLEHYRSSIFLSWSWIGAWLVSINEKVKISAIYFHNSDNDLVGMAFLVKEKIRRRRLFTLDVISLNETTSNKLQFIIEYNNILHNPNYRDSIYIAFFDFLKNSPLSFDELQLHTLDKNNIPNIKHLANSAGFGYLCEKESNANFVELCRYSNDPDKFITTLSKNKREQVRRSIRYFKKFGEMHMEMASCEKQALEFFNDLGTLHQKYWVNKGNSGSFSNKNWVEFHSHLITNNFNNIQIIKLSFGDHIVGYLYNFIDNKTVYSIQSGFNYGPDKNNRPGLVLHYFAIRHAIDNNFDEYDFLVGDNQYKRSLSNSHNTCSWIQVQNNTKIIRLENISIKSVRLIQHSFTAFIQLLKSLRKI